MLRFLLLFAVCAVFGWPRMGFAKEVAEKSDVKSVLKSNSEFALALYRQLRDKEGNLFFSPYSISNALGMTAAGARGETLNEMAKTLHFSGDLAKVSPAFRQLIESLNGDPKTRKYQLNVANALWCQKGYGFEAAFLKLTEKDYFAGLKQVNFAGESEKSRLEINHWVEEQTKDKIKDLLKTGTIDSNTRLVLTNAIYFKAAWLKPFFDKATKEDDFLIGEGKKVGKVPLMHTIEDCQYAEGDDFQLLELPYEDYQLSLIVLLPKKVDGLTDLEKKITVDSLEKWRSKAKEHQVTITMPKFKTTAEFELSETLKKMGMPLAFTEQGDFTGITKDEKLYISKVVHKAFIDLDEKGTEAAAATAVIMKRASAAVHQKPKANFKADHPFVYMIRDQATGSILFMGRLTDPLAK
jgi:serpin B